ncbi:MAG: PHP domain-containing protein [Ignavibacteria bacterium]
MQKNYDSLKADLHLHTFFSDGKLSPEELIRKAKLSGIDTLSITDHDSVEGVEEAMHYGKLHDIEIIPGVELSSEYKGQEVHVLGYFMDYKEPRFLEYLSSFRAKRLMRAEKIVERLNSMNIKITIKDVLSKTLGNASIGRPHIAFALMAANVVSNYNEAFFKYLGDNKPAFVKKPNIGTSDAVKLITESGGLSFIAHPGKTIRDNLIIELIEQGVDGIEIIHPSHTRDDIGYFLDITGQYFLLESGGSDFHGGRMNDDSIFGNYYIPVSKVNAMKNRLFSN